MNPPFFRPHPSTSAVAGARAAPVGAAEVVAVVPTAPVVAGLEVAEAVVAVAAAVAELGVVLVAGPGAPAVPVAGGQKHRSGAVVRPS